MFLTKGDGANQAVTGLCAQRPKLAAANNSDGALALAFYLGESC